ncbi:MAG: substrate-binding domain-containing protein, partial [Pseudomonadota bacterium]
PEVSISEGYLAVSFQRQAKATDLTYTVETSADMVTWTTTETQVGDAQAMPDGAEKVTLRALEQNPDAIGVYSAGAPVQGVAQGIAAANLPVRPVLIDHELTESSARLLRAGVIDAVITQNTGHLARSALRVLRAKCDKTPVIKSQENIRIDIVLRENLPSMK